MKKFSIVIPVAKDEADLVKQNLLSWCNLASDELLLCVDYPLNDEDQCKLTKIYRIVDSIRPFSKVDIRFLHVFPNPAYNFHQAWVRRCGFIEASNDVILTGDIDLYVYSSCLKALEFIGEKNVGLVSLSKLRNRHGFIGCSRNVMEKLTRFIAQLSGSFKAGKAYFTGLYWLYRPYWKDSESEEGIKHLEHPYRTNTLSSSWGGYVGEDTYLRNCMVKKHRVLYLADIGAEDMRPGLEDRKEIQYKIGAKFALERMGLLKVAKHALVHLRLYTLIGYFSMRLRK